jgi:Pyridine nucleotide-disulphide oxidoreductase, dimerisation domain
VTILWVLDPCALFAICQSAEYAIDGPFVSPTGKQGTPELTPVAIQAGIMLAKRLFAKSNEAMDYVNVCTTVFTPIEYSCVGISEDDAKAQLGEDNIEVYHRTFLPLEWSLSMSRSYHRSFAKVIVDKTSSENVLGVWSCHEVWFDLQKVDRDGWDPSHHVGRNCGHVHYQTKWQRRRFGWMLRLSPLMLRDDMHTHARLTNGAQRAWSKQFDEQRFTFPAT